MVSWGFFTNESKVSIHAYSATCDLRHGVTINDYTAKRNKNKSSRKLA